MAAAKTTAAATKSVAKKTKKTPVKGIPPVPGAIAIPKDARQNADGTFSSTDNTGKKWIYSKTPFGVMKSEDAGMAATAAPHEQMADVKATDNGDTVRFERQSPFGPIRVDKKKSELTDDERMLLQRQTQAPAQKPE